MSHRESVFKRCQPWRVGLDPAMSDLPASVWKMLPRERQGSRAALLGQMALFWALLASGQIAMRSVDDGESLAEKPIDQIIDHAA